MSDRRLLDLKRIWEASTSTADESAYLRERARAGDLSLERLELARLLGSVAASAVLGVAVPADVDMERLQEGLKPCGREACVRALMAASRATLSPEILGALGDRVNRVETVLQLAQEWVTFPSGEKAEAAWEFAVSDLFMLNEELTREAREAGSVEGRGWAALASYSVAACAYAGRFTSARREPVLAVRGALRLAVDALPDANPDRLLAAVAAELLPWVLR